MSRLKEALEDVQRTAAQLLKRKLEIEPDPVDANAAADAGAAADVDDSASAGQAAPRAGGPLAAEPTSRDDAASRVVGAARYLRANDPYNPAAYTLLRGFRWGELRVSPGVLNPKLLEAPATNVRVNLKGLLLDARWPELLEAVRDGHGHAVRPRMDRSPALHADCGRRARRQLRARSATRFEAPCARCWLICRS